MKIKNKRGRPLHPNWPPEKVVELGEELITWLRSDEGKKAFHLSEFFADKKELSKTEWDLLRHRSEFFHYYERAMLMMGNIVVKNGHVPTAYGSRFLSMYFKDLKEHEKEIKDEEAKALAKARIEVEHTKSIPPNDQIIKKDLEHAREKAELLERIKRLEEISSEQKDSVSECSHV